jgi:hypothetical protein
VVAQRNDRRLDLTNGTLATVSGVDVEHRTVTLRTDEGRTIEPSVSYLADGHLAPAYALTAHKAQGMTVDQAFVLGSEELYREWGYTALSRHRDRASFFVNAPADQASLPGLEALDDPVADELDRTLGRSRAKEMATDVLARARPRHNLVVSERVERAERIQESLRRASERPATSRRPDAPLPNARRQRPVCRRPSGCSNLCLGGDGASLKTVASVPARLGLRHPLAPAGRRLAPGPPVLNRSTLLDHGRRPGSARSASRPTRLSASSASCAGTGR